MKLLTHSWILITVFLITSTAAYSRRDSLLHVEMERNKKQIEANTVNTTNANWTFKFGGPFYSHLFIDKTGPDSDVVIPCQSVFDVQIAARLGFQFIEGNVHATATPGKYVVIHGTRGKLGDQVTDLEGNSVADVVIKESPFDDIRSKYVYRSKYAKYRTPISSLEEFLMECRKNNIAPMIQYVEPAQVDLIRSIMGDNFILYCGRRDVFEGPILEYHTFPTIKEIVDRCKLMGPPYMYCMGNTAHFTDEQLRVIVREVHNVGCHVGFAGCYESPLMSQRLFSLGFDFSAAGWDINEIRSGNLCNLTADVRFDDFTTDGRVEDAVLVLRKGETVKPNAVLKPEFLSGGSLHIRYEGRIRLDMGEYIHHEFESDGTQSMWFSTYFMEHAPGFRITAKGDVRIINITYKASKM